VTVLCIAPYLFGGRGGDGNVVEKVSQADGEGLCRAICQVLLKMSVMILHKLEVGFGMLADRTDL